MKILKPLSFTILYLYKAKKGTKYFYEILTHEEEIDAHFLQKWEEDLKINLDLKSWENIPMQNLLQNYQRQLSYLVPVLYGLVSTNHYLLKIKVCKTFICRLCKEYKETIIHLFTVVKVQNFGNTLKYG